MGKGFFAIFTTILIWTTAATGADLNAAVVPKVTIKTEIQRGGDAAFRCLIKTHTDWPTFSACLDEVLSEQTQRNTITDPFRLGFYYRAYDFMSALLKARVDLKDNSLFVEEQSFYYKTQAQLRKSLHLTEADICHALEITTCKASAPP